jgi:hypothetical protein
MSRAFIARSRIYTERLSWVRLQPFGLAVRPNRGTVFV